MQEEYLCPKGVCVNCVTAVLAAQELRVLVQESQKIWKQATTVLHGFPSIGNVDSAQSLCAFLSGEPLQLEIVRDSTTVNLEDPVTTFNKIKNKITRRKTIVRKPRQVRNGPAKSCPDCGKMFSSPFYLNIHLQNSSHKEACVFCGEVTVRGQETLQHMINAHNKKALLCLDCPLIFTDARELEKHKKSAHKPSSLTCSDCGRTFPRISSYDAHTQMHTVRTCRNCEIQFSNRACYRVHRANCEPDAKPAPKTVSRSKRSNLRDLAKYICDYCQKAYNSRAQLKNHITWIHLDVRPHQCSWCGKAFYTSARLSEHTIVHTRERKFACDICGAKLVTKMAMIYHRRRHTGEKPYECEDCGEKFISASRRSEHAKRRHKKGALFNCTQCMSSFVRSQELRKHAEKAHNTIVSSAMVSEENKIPKMELDKIDIMDEMEKMEVVIGHEVVAL